MQGIRWQSGGEAAATRIENAAANGADDIGATLLAIRKRADDAEGLKKPIQNAADKFTALWRAIGTLARQQARTLDEWGPMLESAKREQAERAPLRGFGSPQDRDVAIEAAQREVVTKAEKQAAEKVVAAKRSTLDQLAADVVGAQFELRQAYDAAIERATGPALFLDSIDDKSLYADGVYENWLRGRKRPISEAFTRWKNAVEREEEDEAVRIARVAMPLIQEWRSQPTGALTKRYGETMTASVLEAERTVAFRFADAIDEWRRKSLPQSLAIAARTINAFGELHNLLLGEHALFLSDAQFERMLNDDSRVPTPALAVMPDWPFRFLPPSRFSTLRTG